jgi:hypothetical protein
MLANALDATRTAVTAEIFCNAENFISFPFRIFKSESVLNDLSESELRHRDIERGGRCFLYELVA